MAASALIHQALAETRRLLQRGVLDVDHDVPLKQILTNQLAILDELRLAAAERDKLAAAVAALKKKG